MKYFVLILICAAINSLDDTDEGYRKLYGISFHKNCGNYFITFKCLTACKSMGFKVFRLDYKCKCTCHELRTTTILPAFVWRTNGTTKKHPATFSPKLYAIVGTMSPPPTETTEKELISNITAPPCPLFNNTDETSHVSSKVNVTETIVANSTTNISNVSVASNASNVSNVSESTTVAAITAALTTIAS